MRITPDQAFEECDVVETDYSGKITRHTILERFKTRNSQTGVTYRVVPPVPKSSGKDAKIDHAWFKRVGRLELNDDDKIIFVPDKTEGSPWPTSSRA